MIDVWRLVPSRKFVTDASQCLEMAHLAQLFESSIKSLPRDLSLLPSINVSRSPMSKQMSSNTDTVKSGLGRSQLTWE